MFDVSPEVVVKTLTDRAGTTPEMTTFITGLRGQLKEKGAPSMLQTVAGRNFDKNAIIFSTEENIGTERDADGKKVRVLGSEEATRMADITRSRDLAVNYLERGYDRLTVGEQGDARTNILNLLNTIPAFQAELALMSATDRTTYVEKFLKDPRYSAILKQKLIEKGGDISKVFADDLSELTRATNALEAEIGIAGTLTTEINNLTTSITTAKADLEEYKVEIPNPLPPPPTRRGIHYERIATLDTEILALDTGIKNKEADIAAQTRIKTGFEGEKAVIDNVVRGGAMPPTPPYMGRGVASLVAVEADILAANGALHTLEGELTTLKTQKAEKAAIKAQIATQGAELKAEIVSLEAKKVEKSSDKVTKEGTLASKKAELAKKKAERRLKEEQFVHSFATLMEDAAEDYVKQRVQEAETEGKTLAEKRATEEKDESKKKLTQTLVEAYFPANKLDVPTVTADFRTMSDTGPEGIVRTMLTTAGYATAQIDGFMANKELATDLQKIVVDNVTKFYFLRGGFLQRGGKVLTDEILKFSVSDWGKTLVTDGLKNRSDLQAQIDKASAGGLLTGRGQLTEFLRKTPWIALILMAAGAGAVLHFV